MNDKLILKINSLPFELINLIKEYVPKKEFIYTNRENFKLYHNLVLIKPNQFFNYVKTIIKYDYEFVFNILIRDNYQKWCEKGKIYYKNMSFGNYIYFILNFCLENESEKCLNTLLIFFKEVGLGKNLHKKNVIKYIKWKP
jgi:hypothetical protein